MDAPVTESATSPPISLDEAKRHCSVEHHEDDALIETFILACTHHLQQTLGPAFPSGAFPFDLKAALLLHVAFLYQQRAIQSELKLEPTGAYEALIWPYRNPGIS